MQDVSKLFTEKLEDDNQQDEIQVRASMNSSPIANSFNSAVNRISGVHRGDQEEGKLSLLTQTPTKHITKALRYQLLWRTRKIGGMEKIYVVINRVVEGVEMQEISRLEYKGTNRGKKKKVMRELHRLHSINYESTSRKTQELNISR